MECEATTRSNNTVVAFTTCPNAGGGVVRVDGQCRALYERLAREGTPEQRRTARRLLDELDDAPGGFSGDVNCGTATITVP